MRLLVLLVCAALAGSAQPSADYVSRGVQPDAGVASAAISSRPPDPAIPLTFSGPEPTKPLPCADCSHELFIEMLPDWAVEAILDQIDVFDTSSTALIYEWLLTMIVGVACAQHLRRRKVRRVRVRRRISTAGW
jgi:hypothetical protein